jgi:hypothetical protein
MHRIRSALAAVLTGTLALGGMYVATTWSVQARLETAAREVSNRAAKQDRWPALRAAPAPMTPIRPKGREEAQESGDATS